MDINKLNELIDIALAEGAKRPGAMKQTNVLNAEFALGKFYALLSLIYDLFGVDEMVKTKERTKTIVDELSIRTQEIY